MSEPMSSGEIEDVLSSIRRLVSEDLRQSSRPAFPSGRPADPAPMPPPVDDRPAAMPGKLLLTPALRVVPAEAAAETVVTGASDQPEQPDPVVTADAAWDVPAGEEGADTPARAEPSAPPTLVLHSSDAPADPDDQTQAWAGEPVVAGPGPAGDRRISQIGAAVTPPPQGWESETGDPPPATRLTWIDVADRHDDPVQAMPFISRTPAPQPQPDPPQPASSPLIGTMSEDVLDEALLREIVREVLRDELQGNLGERMTRNIRKLVRAEVQRAMTLRDWD